MRMNPLDTLMVREVLLKCYLIIKEDFPDSVCYIEEPKSKDYNHSHVKCHLPSG